MVDRRSLWLLLPRPVRALPADLAFAIALTVLVNVAVFAPLIRDTPLRVPLGLAFVLFVPGYVFVAALFPEAGESPPTDSGPEDPDDADSRLGRAMRSGIDGIERVALSFGLSIAIVPLLGLVLNFTPWGIRLVPIMVAVSGFTLVATAVAAVRRWQLPEEDQFQVPYRDWLEAGRAELFEPASRADAALNVLLVLSVLLAVSTVTYAVVVPPQGEQFSAVYILTEDDDGELVADGYPTEFVRGESKEIVVGVDNHEHRPVNYTVVVLEQDVDVIENETVGENGTVVENETIVTEQRELDRFQTRLAHNETWHYTQDLEPTMTGENNRIVWLLYPDDVSIPANPSMESTEYHVHLWVNVSDSSADQ